MKIITKYLGTTIIVYTSMVLLLLLGLQAFIEFMREFPNIGTEYYGIKQVLIYVPLMLPSDVYQLFPMAGLLGCIIALGLLAAHSELIILRTSGMSLANITIVVTKAAIVLITIMFAIGEGLAPLAQNLAIKNKTIAMSKGQTLLTQQGTWVRSDDNFIHVSFATKNNELQGITRYEFDANRQLKTASYAESGVYQNGKWLFKNIKQTIFTATKTTSATFPAQVWDLTLNSRLIGMAQIDPDQKSLLQLYSYINHRKQNGLNTISYEFIFWQRIFTPLATLIMILLAVPFVFGPLRNTTMGLRMLVGVMLGFGFYIFNQFVGSISIVYQIAPIFAAILPTLLFAIIGSIILVKT